MLMLLYAALALASLFFIGTIVVYLHARRASSAVLQAGHSEREWRQRAALDDFGDGAVWQMRQGAKRVCGYELPVEHVTTRRGFLPLLSSMLLILSARRGAADTNRGAAGGKKPLAWEQGHPERSAWSDQLRQAIRDQIGSLEQASDIKDFAPGYDKFSAEERVDVWASLFVAIARFETDPPYNTHSIHQEPSVPGHPEPIDSIGLFQISYENQTFYDLEPLDPSAKSLEDPLVNVRCAAKIMAYWVQRDKVIASGSQSSGRGGARYWSTLWPSGHLAEIRKIVRDAAPHTHIDTPHGDHYDSHH
jgi:hypothetical protein